MTMRCMSSFSNPIGMDYHEVKNGCSMILDPFGDVVAECRALGDDFCLATLTEDKIERAGGTRYLQARRPDLYREIVGMAHTPVQKVAWKTACFPGTRNPPAVKVCRGCLVPGIDKAKPEKAPRKRRFFGLVLCPWQSRSVGVVSIRCSSGERSPGARL